MIKLYDIIIQNMTFTRCQKEGMKIVAVASLVLGICSLVFPFIGLGWLSCIVGIVGTILGALGRKDLEKKGMATAGMVMSIISVAFGVILWLACAACIGGLASLA